MIRTHHLIILTAIFLISFGNQQFFSNIFEVYPASFENIGFLISITWVFTGVTILLFSLACYRYTIKPVIIGILLASSFAAYFMDSYKVVLDATMIQNMLSTDVAEARDLLNVKLVLYVLFLGILPSYLVFRSNLLYLSRKREALSRFKLIGATSLSIVAALFLTGDYFSSFIREHKSLRLYANPQYYVYSTSKFLAGQFEGSKLAFKTIGLDAQIPVADLDRELIIVVVGETARVDHFSLNGYARQTTPLLEKEALVSFTNFWSCGTSTAVSVPCMFSSQTTAQFKDNTAKMTGNVLDILTHADINVLWLDNNSDSKGVADRVPYQSYKNADINPVCDIECRDIGMLAHLQEYIDSNEQGDIVIVLHQMGQHGPAYFKRYPAAFEKFTPVCKTSQLENCSTDEIINAYDNAILYTDYFLSNVISFLKQNNNQFETAMFYVSDHGESLGENNLYLHGLPNFIAPDTQRHVPAIIWLGKNYEHADLDKMLQRKNNLLSHDNVFHTLLGFVEIESTEYDATMDLLQN